MYPIGVPLFFFHVLYRYRYRRDEPGVRLQVGFLYEAYESSSWYTASLFHHIPLICRDITIGGLNYVIWHSSYV